MQVMFVSHGHRAAALIWRNTGCVRVARVPSPMSFRLTPILPEFWLEPRTNPPVRRPNGTGPTIWRAGSVHAGIFHAFEQSVVARSTERTAGEARSACRTTRGPVLPLRRAICRCSSAPRTSPSRFRAGPRSRTAVRRGPVHAGSSQRRLWTWRCRQRPSSWLPTSV